MITLEQRNFISVLESKNIEGEHQLPYLKQRFKLTDNQTIQLQNEYWDVIYEEIKQPVKPMITTNKFNTVDNLSRKGEQSINKTATGFIYNMGLYHEKFDFLTFVKNIALLSLLIGGLIVVMGIMFLGWHFL